MRTRLLLLLVCVWVAAPAAPASAHLTGVFAYFMEDLGEPTATSRLLRQQLDASADRIAELAPAIAEAQRNYAEKSDAVVRSLRFYDVYTASAVGALWAGAQDPIEVLAVMELMRRRVDSDLTTLAELEAVYSQIQSQEKSLARYEQLLGAYEASAEAREQRFADLPEGTISPFGEPYAIYEVAEAWEALRPTIFLSFFDWATTLIAENLEDVLEPSGVGSWELREDALNLLLGGDTVPFVSDAQFYLRGDHVTLEARLTTGTGVYHLLTIGQIERVGPTSIQYRIEAIFLDGLPIDPNDPDVQREVYEGDLMRIDIAPLLPSESGQAIFEQQSGQIAFRAR